MYMDLWSILGSEVWEFPQIFLWVLDSYEV